MMLVLAAGVFCLFLTLVLSVAGAPSCARTKACTKPSVRKEWRALKSQEKAAWIKAVNVHLERSADSRDLIGVDCSACHICRMTPL